MATQNKDNKEDSKQYKTFLGVRVLWPPECPDDILQGCIEETLNTLKVHNIEEKGAEKQMSSQNNCQQIDFKPELNTIKEIVQYLEGTQVGDNQKQQEIYNQTQELVQNPEFFMYLATIMSHENEFNFNIRLLAIVTLQAQANRHYDKLSQSQQALNYIKQQIYKSFNDSNNILCSKIGNIVTVLIQHGGFSSWPEILDFLQSNLESKNQHSIETSVSCLGKIFEDLRLNYENYSRVDSMSSAQKLDIIIPKLLQLTEKFIPNSIRSKTFYCLNIAIYIMPTKLEENLESYCKQLVEGLQDKDSDIRLRCVQGIQTVMETSYSDYFDKYIQEVIYGICHLSGDDNYEVAKNACSFWQEYVSEWEEDDTLKLKLKYIEKHLDILIPNLIKGMRFSEQDQMNQFSGQKNYIKGKEKFVGADEDAYFNEGVDGQAKIGENQQDDENKDFFADDGEDTLRRVSGILMLKFSQLYRDKVFYIAQPLISKLFESPDWVEQEMGVLALGQIVEGSQEVISQHSESVFPTLIQKLLSSNQNQFLVTTFWTLSKFTFYVVEIAPQQENLVKEYLKTIVKGIQHKDYKVQESSCYTLSVLINQGSFILKPFLNDILEVFVGCINSYNGKSTEQLYNAIQSLVSEMQDDTVNQAIAQKLLPSLVQKFLNLAIDNPIISPVSECLAVISDILDKYFGPYCQQVFQKCYLMLDNFLNPEKDDKNNEYNRKEICLRAIDVLLSVVLVSKGDFLGYTQDTKFQYYLQTSLDNKYMELKQFVVSLISEISKHCPQMIVPQLEFYVQKISTFVEFHPQELDPEGQSAALCNNAVWCILEFCFAFKEKLQPFAYSIALKLVEFLTQSDQQIDIQIARNFSKAIGKLGVLDPQQIGTLLPKFIKKFCLTLRNQKEDSQYTKGEAFEGIFIMIRHNPQGILNNFQYLLECFVNYKQAKPDLKQEFSKILQDFRSTMDQQQWEQYLSDPRYFTPGFRNKVKQEYNL
ncbi:Armadillo-type fold [Pseudocohnilembus persalinus]|uniref:Armadillo-type fold n=1 Tax=Pseudocohnilembus persalinus TaxID=266149 RepID=A0A0V0QMV5_PSEPJ|nr:Armadillo-type fold [Pseudocohnilembus persalinus]|eukprot:KRX03479.1 Armadillo-type fold [Pseudocohnilembus persalinus]